MEALLKGIHIVSSTYTQDGVVWHNNEKEVTIEIHPFGDNIYILHIFQMTPQIFNHSGREYCCFTD